NRAFEQQTGMREAVGKTARELVPDLEPEWVERYARVALSGKAARFTDETKALGRWFDVYATRVEDPESRQVVLLFTDITQRKRNEDDLRRLADSLAKSDQRKTEFLATHAHELRNPLAPIQSGLDMMR